MAKRQRSVSLSFVLFRFAVSILGWMLLCCGVWLFGVTLLQNNHMVYPGYVSNQQTEALLAQMQDTFVPPGDDFLPEYVLMTPDGQVAESNVSGGKIKSLIVYFDREPDDVHICRYVYKDGSILILRGYFRKAFVNPTLRKILPPFDYLWGATLAVACILCVVFKTLWLRRRLADKLKLFGQVSEKVGAQKLDFDIPYAGIKEYDQALEAMDDMRSALYHSLAQQWSSQQARESEIAALAHDLKSPLTLIGGNAELLLEEALPESARKMAETIVSSNDRAKQYVSSLLEASAGADEAFASVGLSDFFETLCRHAQSVSDSKNVSLKIHNNLRGSARIQKVRLLRAIGNVVQNAVEHTPAGKTVAIAGCMIPNGWQITVCDEGAGFSKAALVHGTERLWRDDTSRSADGHHGLGLWFAHQVIRAHSGNIKLGNSDTGGRVVINFDDLSTYNK